MRVFLFVVMTLILFSGCSRIPEPTGFLYSSQSKLQAAHHWDVLAQDIANQINNELVKDNLLNTAVYVKKTCGEDDRSCNPTETSQFDEAFHDLLVTELVRYGIPTSVQPDQGTIKVNYKVQTVFHQSDRVRSLAPGVITGLTAAVEVLRNASSEVVAVATAGAVDWASSSYVKNGHYEVIITTSMARMRKYLFRSSNIYYINDADFWHYQQRNTKAKKMRLVGSDFAAALPPKPKAPLKPADKSLPKPIRDI